MTTTQTMTITRVDTIRNFFDKHKIPYCFVRHEFDEEDGIKKKRVDKSSLPNKDWIKHSYETMMDINDYNQRAGDTTIMAYLKNSKFGVFDCDSDEGRAYCDNKLQKTNNYTLSISKDLPHFYFIKNKNDPAVNRVNWQQGLDLCYTIIFEKIDGEMQEYDLNNMQTFNNYPIPEPVITPASVMRLDDKERIFDPTILDIIDRRYFGKGKYSDWSRIMWSIIYCWGEDEGRELCIKYSIHEDYTEQQTADGVDDIINHYNSKKSNKFGTLCHYAKISGSGELYNTWFDNNKKNYSLSIKDVAMKILRTELNKRICICNGEFFFKPDEYDPNWIRGEKDIKRQLRRDILFNGEKYQYFKLQDDGEYTLIEMKEKKQLDDCTSFILDLTETDNKFTTKRWVEGLGKICFNNGYYDFVDGQFKPYDSHNTLIKIDRDFKPCNLEIRQEIYDKVINPIFGDNILKRDAFLYNMGMAMAGDITFKKWIHVQGERCSGKGVMCDFVGNSFENYVRETSTANFYKKHGNSDKDEAKAKSFMYFLQFARLVCCNESEADVVLSGTSIKAFCSGGDYHQVRINHKDEVDIRLQSVLMILSNDFFNVVPRDATEKLITYDMKSVFLSGSETEAQLTGINYYPEDKDIRFIFLEREDVKNEICHIIFDAHKTPKEYIYNPPIQDDETLSIPTIIRENFVLAPGAQVSNGFLREFLKYMKIDKEIKLRKFNMYIKGIFPSIVTYHSGAERGWDGLVCINDIEDD